MKAEKIVLTLAMVGLGTALIQAILRKMLWFNLWGYLTNTLYISIILLFAMPLAMYGLIKLLDNIDKQRGDKSVREYLFGG